jgi:multidrug efflux system outer membrane protein
MTSRPLAASLLAFALAGCAWLAPDYERPSLDLPAVWAHAPKDASARAETSAGQWWLAYHDDTLTRLIDEALANNDDLSLATARLQQAKAGYDFAVANQFPLLAAVGLAERGKTDFDKSLLLSDKPYHLALAGGLLSYEVDLWGKQASLKEASQAAFHASAAARDAVRLSVAAATAQLYFNLLALDADDDILGALIEAQEKTHALVTKQVQAEAASDVTLRQSEAALAAVRAERPRVRLLRAKAESALATLLGRSPRAVIEGKIDRGLSFAALPVLPIEPTSLPSQLLERRPDIAAAEGALIASNFKIGAARAAFFPTISLSTLLGVTSLDLQNLYTGTARTWSMGGSLAGPVLDFGRTESGVDLALAENQERLVTYKHTVRTAFVEVKDALAAQLHARDVAFEQEAKERALRAALRLANRRLEAGYASALDALSVERTWHEARLAVVASKLDQLQSAVALTKALGGGWTASTDRVERYSAFR